MSECINNKNHEDNLYATTNIVRECQMDPQFLSDIGLIVRRFFSNDWGDTDESDKRKNDMAIKKCNDRVIAKYSTSKGNIFIITEYDGSSTTIMFTSEY